MSQYASETFMIYDQKIKPNEIITIGQIYEIMGPITKGEIINDKYVLNYRHKGIKFLFKIPNSRILKEISVSNDLPFKLSDESTLILDEISIISGNETESSLNSAKNSKSIFTKPSVAQNVTQNSIFGTIGTQGSLLVQENKIRIRDKEFDFNKSRVEILREIGKPDLEYYKKGSTKNLNSIEICWVFSELGLEIIQDLDNEEIRLVLHYNVPGHWDFYKFRKCFFKVERGAIEFNHDTEFKEFKKLLTTYGLGSPLVVSKNKSGFGSTWSYAFSFGVIVQVSGNEQIVSIILTKV